MIGRMATTARDLTLALALQGGGAHGAFTWGVLDRLLEEPRLSIEAISATSSGAMNAVALAQGWMENGRDGARATLAALWDAVAQQNGMLQWAFAGPAGAGVQSWLSGMARHFAPGQINPLGINPLRGILARLHQHAQHVAARAFVDQRFERRVAGVAAVPVRLAVDDDRGEQLRQARRR